jgi:hypothetical protein
VHKIQNNSLNHTPQQQLAGNHHNYHQKKSTYTHNPTTSIKLIISERVSDNNHNKDNICIDDDDINREVSSSDRDVSSDINDLSSFGIHSIISDLKREYRDGMVICITNDAKSTETYGDNDYICKDNYQTYLHLLQYDNINIATMEGNVSR